MEEKNITTFWKAETKESENEAYAVDAVLSYEMRDRHGDLIEPEEIIKGAKNFLLNPVLLNSHDQSSLKNVLGKVEDLRAEGKKLCGRIKYFARQGNDMADYAYMLAKQKLATYSIGARAKKMEPIK